MSKEQVKELLIRSKIYSAFAIIFLVGGLGAFAYFYFEKFDGDIKTAIMNPISAGFFVVSLVPSLFFTWRAGVAENKMVKLIDKLKD
ncbi:MAG: hypothetical protein DHS20C02_01900 [Micavibrio sp.]|nr:MAG: hypothetical protein DHS20C02_01900 [Micavibrio sp.]